MVAVLIGRDLVLSLTLPRFSLLLLADDGQGWLQAVAEAFAVAFTGWGVALYLWSGVLYLLRFGSQWARRGGRALADPLTSRRLNQTKASELADLHLVNIGQHELAEASEMDAFCWVWDGRGGPAGTPLAPAHL